jgi:hypothetical protein
MSGKARLGIILAMLAMLLAVSVPAMAQDVDECDFDENGFVSEEEADDCTDEDDPCDFDGDDSVSEEEADDCADALEDLTGADVQVLCVDDDDEDGLIDEDGDDDGEDDDEDGLVDEDDDCDADNLVFVVEDVENLSF